jgi:dTDP-glucose pyrophosphorylase/predicted transcriptional regulator
MKNLKELLVRPAASIRDAIERIDVGSMQIALVVDETGRLVGTVTDGDVRRGLLRGIGLEQPVDRVMNPKPTVAHVSQDRDSVKALMRSTGLRQIPILDDDGRVIDLIELMNEFISGATRDNWVVLMAGGLGTRLRPLTEDVPKPLLPVGGRPLIENIVTRMVEQGFRRFFISVNYKGDMIKAHFGDGSRWAAQIDYLEEPMRLGTAGALSLLPAVPRSPFLVVNADLLTKVNFSQLIDFHIHHASRATMCVREHDLKVPFGVVTLDEHHVIAIDEKPTHRFFINAGIYLLEPSVLDYARPNTYMDMTTLFEQLIRDGASISAFPIREYWRDIGQHDDLERARSDSEQDR